MNTKGFKHTKNVVHPNKSESVILENKHRIIDIHFLLKWVKGVGNIMSGEAYITIKDKRTNQNKNYNYSNFMNNNIPNKYNEIVKSHILDFYNSKTFVRLPSVNVNLITNNIVNAGIDCIKGISSAFESCGR